MHILASGETSSRGRNTSSPGGRGLDRVATDPALRELAVAAAEGWTPHPWPRGLNLLLDIENRPPRTFVGRVGSADIWTQHHERIDEI